MNYFLRNFRLIGISFFIPLLSCTNFSTNLEDVNMVYITPNHWSETFHSTPKCKVINNYKGDLVPTKLKDIMISEFQPCGFCFNPTESISHPSSIQHNWIEQGKSQAGFEVYFWDDIKYGDGLYYLNVYFYNPDSEKNYSECYIYNSNLTEYKVEESNIHYDRGGPTFQPLFEGTFPYKGANFIRDNLSWDTAIHRNK